MDPIEVTVDPDGMVTVTIVDSDGKPATWQLRFEDAEALQAKLFSRLNDFHNRSELRQGNLEAAGAFCWPNSRILPSLIAAPRRLSKQLNKRSCQAAPHRHRVTALQFFVAGFIIYFGFRNVISSFKSHSFPANDDRAIKTIYRLFPAFLMLTKKVAFNEFALRTLSTASVPPLGSGP